MKKVPIHIINNSKSQISAEFEGNTTSPIYQQGAEYIQNALIVPNGSVKKRPGTRFIGLSLHGDRTVLKAYNGLMLASGYGFVTAYNGLNVVTLDRGNLNPNQSRVGTFVKPTVENGVMKNAFSSDVLVEYVDNTPVYVFPDKGSSLIEEKNYFVDRANLPYDTYLHKSVDILPDTTVKPTSDGAYAATPDSTPPSDVSNVKYFPSQQTFSDKVRVVIKTPITLDNLKEYVVGGGSLYTVIINSTANTHTTEQIVFGNLPLNNIYQAEIKKDFRILQLKELANTNLFENDGTTNDQTIRVDTTDVGNTSTTQSFIENSNIDKLFLTTFFQNRVVVAGSNVTSGAFLVFSAQGNPNDFNVVGTSTETSAFALTLSVITYPEVTVLHAFGNNLVIGTPDAIYSVQNGGSGIAVNPKEPIAAIKISDIGVSSATPFLYQDKLYLAQNGRQGILELVKDPYSSDIQVRRIMTFSDSVLVNGYIKKIFIWNWDYQYIGALMSDGMVIKANLDDENINFNNWIFDKDTVLDVEPLVVKGQEDLLYFAIQRAGVTLIEVMMNHQHVQKLEHSYSCVRKRATEEEMVNRYVSGVLPRYCRNGTYNDCAITLKATLPQTGTISIAGNTAVLAGADDALDVGDVLEGGGHIIHVLAKVNSSRYSVSNGSGFAISNSSLKDFRLKKKKWKHPMLKFMKGRGDLSANVDGISFSVWNEDLIADDGVMVLGEAAEWITVGVMYRFALVSLPIVASYAAEGLMRRRLLGPVHVLFHFSYMIEVGVVMDKLDLKRFDPEEAIVWEQVAVFNGDEERNRLVLKLDHACPVEVVSFACEYGV